MVVKIPYFSAQSWDHIYDIAHSQKICVHELKEVIPAETGTNAGLWGESFRNPSRKIPENMCFQRNICLGLLVRSQWMSSSRRNELVVLAQLIAAGWLFLSKLLLKPQNRILREGAGSCIPYPANRGFWRKPAQIAPLGPAPAFGHLQLHCETCSGRFAFQIFFPFQYFSTFSPSFSPVPWLPWQWQMELRSRLPEHRAPWAPSHGLCCSSSGGFGIYS